MANEKGLKLLSKLDFYPEYREDGGKTPVVETGRFKYFREVSKRRNAPLLTANLMFLITLIPLLALFILLEVFGGTEAIAYKLSGVEESPYLLAGIGFGASDVTMTALDVQMKILDVYYIIFAVVGAVAFIMSIGFGGMTHLSMKFIIGDSFISKKDNYGNNVPKAIKEYFKGIKRTWKEMSLVGIIFLVLFAGIANLFVLFVGKFWQNAANAGYWIMIILASICVIFTLMFLVHFIPTIALYDMPLKSKLKNSAIFALQMFPQNLAIVAVFSVPFILIATLDMFIGVIIIAVLLCYGSKWYSLTLCNFEQYLSEKIVTPVYNARYGKNPGKAKKSKKKTR